MCLSNSSALLTNLSPFHTLYLALMMKSPGGIAHKHTYGSMQYTHSSWPLSFIACSGLVFQTTVLAVSQMPILSVALACIFIMSLSDRGQHNLLMTPH